MLMSVLKAIEDQQILNNIYSAPDDMKSFGHVLRHVSLHKSAVFIMQLIILCETEFKARAAKQLDKYNSTNFCT